MGKTLYDKVIDLHAVEEVSAGRVRLFVGLHLVHEATSAPAFAMLKERGLVPAHPDRTFAVTDHVIPTDGKPWSDPVGQAMEESLRANSLGAGIRYAGPGSEESGVVHVIGPELGLTQPGMTVACGDSHTSTHGAFGAVAFGVGTTQVAEILASQTVVVPRLPVRQVRLEGRLPRGVYAKDVILHVIHEMGAKAGAGWAYEFSGSAVEQMSMEERMTLCNMAVEAGARYGYVNPDKKTIAYIKGRRYAPQNKEWDKAVAFWESIRSDSDAVFGDVVQFNVSNMEPAVTWGILPEHAVPVTGAVPADEGLEEARAYMGFQAGAPVRGTVINTAFIGSCTNGRISDFEEAAKILKGRRVAPGVRTLAVPGSERVLKQIRERGLDKVFADAGFELRKPGCSMCLAMNNDKLTGTETAASSSNRNFKGRQGSPTGRTLLMSPAMVAAAAVAGRVVDVRGYLEGGNNENAE
ncbi:MAG: 3-isopropylmalate dehydratase large subunit [Spirochaetia bacterium]|nr:3-isopropylmalate dehydratase large subunit [Spirochaetia bacterium]